VDNERRTALNSGCVMTTDPTTSGERPDAQRMRRLASSSDVRRPSRAAPSSIVRRPMCPAASNSLPTSGASNKPMVPTAHDGPNDNSIDPMRRHIGEPLGADGDDNPPINDTSNDRL
jgi:hypothetical protein